MISMVDFTRPLYLVIDDLDPTFDQEEMGHVFEVIIDVIERLKVVRIYIPPPHFNLPLRRRIFQRPQDQRVIVRIDRDRVPGDDFSVIVKPILRGVVMPKAQ